MRFPALAHGRANRVSGAAPGRSPGDRSVPELKGSIGEGPNHSNHSNRSNSFKIGIFTRKFKNFRKFQHSLNLFGGSWEVEQLEFELGVRQLEHVRQVEHEEIAGLVGRAAASAMEGAPQEPSPRISNGKVRK